MTWTQLLANSEVQQHKTSKKELDSIRVVIARDLADASLKGLSPDRCFATAYNAALQAAKMAIACAGYRVTTAGGHHRISFEGVKFAIGKTANPFADYFDRCRRKRNVIDYEHAYVATETEAEEIVKKAKEFFALVEQWIATNHPALK
ncbi:MAG TPA: HEPN domain-containing protein [Candidatus Angelobacter sp.]|nr:HEPN domain-containing protein [Candidatus Angelobacter sp.]